MEGELKFPQNNGEKVLPFYVTETDDDTFTKKSEQIQWNTWRSWSCRCTFFGCKLQQRDVSPLVKDSARTSLNLCLPKNIGLMFEREWIQVCF